MNVRMKCFVIILVIAAQSSHHVNAAAVLQANQGDSASEDAIYPSPDHSSHTLHNEHPEDSFIKHSLTDSESHGQIRHHKSHSHSSTEPPSPAPDCPECQKRPQPLAEDPEYRQFQIELIKLKILDQLGLSEVPIINTTNRVPLPRQLLHEMSDHTQRDQPVRRKRARDTNPAADKIAVFGEQVFYPDDPLLSSSLNIEFQFPRKAQQVTVDAASLWLYMDPAHSSDEPVVVYISDINGKYHHISELPKVPGHIIAKKHIHEHHWVRLDLTSTTSRWLRHGHVARRLAISCKGCARTENSTIPNASILLEGENKPFMVIHTKTRPKRTRRNADQCTSGGCCRVPITLNFEAIGWEWLIEPKIIETAYCAGSCLGFTERDLYVDALRNHWGVKIPPSWSLCCSVSETSNFSTLYYSEDGRIMRDVLRMGVEACSCF